MLEEGRSHGPFFYVYGSHRLCRWTAAIAEFTFHCRLPAGANHDRHAQQSAARFPQAAITLCPDPRSGERQPEAQEKRGYIDEREHKSIRQGGIRRPRET
jgi:hypothetical protein